MITNTFTKVLLQRSLLLQAAGVAMAAGSAAYYFTHPQRVVAELPPDLSSGAQDVYLLARDGARLHAVWLPGPCGSGASPFERTIVHHHGFNGSGGVVLARKAFYRRGVLRLSGHEDDEPLLAWPLVRAGLARGYNFLLVDARSHGRSRGAWDASGAAAAHDLMGWVKWLRNEQGQLWVGLWGNSFGASVGLGLACRPAGGGFDAMVLDSPVITTRGVYGGLIHKPLYWVVQPVLRQLGNKDLQAQVQSAHPWMPILLIHGREDTHVPAWQSEQVYDHIHNPAAPERAGLWLVPGADHLEALEVAPDAYVRQTLDWFDHWFGGAQ